ncbi:probable mitochondrial saccharopine dehydrogenase-like oxidoreductase At5g39410 [Cryptomeria japonica]|uniref:probable mitochondrial saccharopine dehydrogenase-like oxidoreductase At5g39410 n=1 Tax=Cryptomeria japonica TaxID=3369 RepID=UPI0027DA8BBC|nr:probable mitochondrial saccharopine dehydrogenase-like oxidoreductase At5g39410 [Cryptomeria japonica]
MGDEGALDAVILGASGFAAKYILREFMRHLERLEGQGRRRIGIAGRNREKLADAVRWAAQGALQMPPLIPIIEADVTDSASMAALCKRTRLIVNCVGPFRLYGEPVVAACVEAGIDYLDITGEPKFMEMMEEHYHSSALLTGSLVVSACAYDYVPADLGVIFHSRQWKPPSVPHSVYAYVVLESEKRVVLNVTTFESAVVAIARAEEDQKLRTYGPLRVPGLPAPKSKIVEHEKSIGLWALTSPTGDGDVARRTQALLLENPYGWPGVNENSAAVEKRRKSWSEVKPVYVDIFIGYKRFWIVLVTICMGLIVFLLGQFRWGRSLLLKYPGIFTFGLFRRTGPTEEEIKSASFKYWFVGHGYSDKSRLLQQGSKPDMEVVTRISGPEVGYATTPIILVQCALIVMDQRQTLPKGGVFPPGIMFGSTDLQERLEKNGILFELISKKTTSISKRT